MKTRRVARANRANRLSLCPETLLHLDPPALGEARGAADPNLPSVPPRCILVSQIFTRCHNCTTVGVVSEVPR